MESSPCDTSAARRLLRGYYFITDHRLTRQGIERDTIDALRSGVTVVQYRRKEGPSRLLYQEARELRALTHGACFLVNDRVDIAMACGADGVHIGQSDLPTAVARKLLGPGSILGVTVRSVEEARLAEAAGADYVGVGAIFGTSTKEDAGPPVGLELLREIRRAIRLPITAIGGITLENAPAVIAAGAQMVCAISAVVADPRPAEAAQRFQNLFASK
ncbi:MAG: thiamine phosphate synthase [Opitutales bacterium]|nr:thiamine phosphate synthase [Opitutales bacterium]